ncbi:MAG: phospho-N-acetylmuramoyl-pentapeptide-transferase [Deltaproteobacteria bacterium]|nr:phospho-N-acetylmuramoyl-pentapeptide-transferase [Candidatus Anaeroferrophillacea bacterium]
MIYHLLYPLHHLWSVFNVFKYITFRTIYASLTALFLAFYITPRVIGWLRRLQVGQVVRDDGPESHLGKAGTPTMGGIVIMFCSVAATLLWADLLNPYIWLVLFVAFGNAALGFVDDYRKLVYRNARGVSARRKLAIQVLIGLVFTVALVLLPRYPTTLMLPFIKQVAPDIGWWYAPFGALVVAGTANAVNLTDGLDGLATGPSIIAFAVYLLFAYLAGHVGLANYLQITFLPGSGELAVFCGAMVGALLGFLWFNAYPASIFMGDVGSLALGGSLGAVAVLTKQEMVLLIVGGIFVLETLSVIIQVASFKLIGRRVFRMAPLHHHFELKGWAEPKVIVRFWIVSIILALVALSTLKLR